LKQEIITTSLLLKIQKENKMKRFILTVMIAGSLMASGCSKQQEQAAAPAQPASMETQAQGMVEQAKDASQEAAQAAASVQQEAQNAANAMMDQAKGLLAQAQELVASGKFEEAIATAQKVLNIDPNNMDAKKIIETAKAKIMEVAQEKAAALKNDLSNKMNALGN
jgi:tetratricopeptide (TPR) repeat protein